MQFEKHVSMAFRRILSGCMSTQGEIRFVLIATHSEVIIVLLTNISMQALLLMQIDNGFLSLG
jgi:hypothetical protein